MDMYCAYKIVSDNIFPFFPLQSKSIANAHKNSNQ